MVVTVIAVHVVQVSVDEVIDVITVRDREMSAAFAMHMVSVVSVAAVALGAARRVPIAHFEGALDDLAVLEAMQVPVVEVIDVVAMLHAQVATVGTVLVVVIRVVVRVLHGFGFLG